MADDIILKPCPFCGAEAFPWPTSNAFFVQCIESQGGRHLVQVRGRTEQEAVTAWNTRKGESDG